ncbi:MAG: hypothetical protein M1834_006482 [Cirrosporium novae-zelandiae]|nr:MAG: hypothetical protein M1834_006482 [Cirrosporium novae-zelandiae]
MTVQRESPGMEGIPNQPVFHLQTTVTLESKLRFVDVTLWSGPHLMIKKDLMNSYTNPNDIPKEPYGNRKRYHDHNDLHDRKEYCTYWIRTGHCTYGHRCKYRHEIPGDERTLARLGFRSNPIHRPWVEIKDRKPKQNNLNYDDKVYCTYWLKFGECDYLQQGCKYKHEMPDFSTLKNMGFTHVPRWFRENHEAPGYDALGIPEWRLPEPQISADRDIKEDVQTTKHDLPQEHPRDSSQDTHQISEDSYQEASRASYQEYSQDVQSQPQSIENFGSSPPKYTSTPEAKYSLNALYDVQKIIADLRHRIYNKEVYMEVTTRDIWRLQEDLTKQESLLEDIKENLVENAYRIWV